MPGSAGGADARLIRRLRIRGGVFGTSGGGTYPDGFNVEERPGPGPRDGPAEPDEKLATRGRHADPFDQVNIEDETP